MKKSKIKLSLILLSLLMVSSCGAGDMYNEAYLPHLDGSTFEEVYSFTYNDKEYSISLPTKDESYYLYKNSHYTSSCSSWTVNYSLKLEYIYDNKLGIYYENKYFKDITTIKAGGKIGLLYYPNSIKSFLIFYSYLQEIDFKLDKLLIIGNGSNILASDKEYTGIVVSFKKVSDRIRIISSKTLKCFEKIVECYSGVMCNKLSNKK